MKINSYEFEGESPIGLAMLERERTTQNVCYVSLTSKFFVQLLKQYVDHIVNTSA